MLLIGHQPDQDGEVVIWVIRDLINANTSKICQHKEGQTDCKVSDKYRNEGYVSKGKQGSKCPNSFIMHYSSDQNEKTFFTNYASLDNQEGIENILQIQ